MRESSPIRANLVRGRIAVYDIWYPDHRQRRPDPPRVEFRFAQPNSLMVDWGHIAARCIGLGDRDFRLGAMYLEFENTTSPGDPVSVPAFDPTDGLVYYSDLAFSPDRDYLRVPLQAAPELHIESGYEAYFQPGVSGNLVTLHAQSQGTAGVHGKPYSAAANSTVFGVALVATPEFADPSQDVLFARAYFAVDNQVGKTPSRQVGITWDVPFGL